MEAVFGKLLVDDGDIAPDRLDEAVRLSVLQGGRLDTYLLELGLIDEARLTDILARAYNLPPADFRALVKVDLQALKVIPSRVAERCQVFPFRLDTEDLHVLSPAPPDLGLLEEIGEMVSKRLRPYAATEYRISRALAHFYGLPLRPRFTELERVLAGDETVRVPLGEITAGIAPVTRLRAEGQGTQDGGWDLIEALAQLSAAKDRDTVIGVSLFFASAFLDCVAFFGVHAGAAIGWDVLGGKILTEDFRGLTLPLEEPSALRTVTQTAAPYLGQVDKNPVHDALYRALGRRRPRSALFFPIMVAGRVVAVLYGDNGRRAIKTNELTDLITFCGRVGPAFENIILARKKDIGTEEAEAQERRDKTEAEPAAEAEAEPAAEVEAEPAAEVEAEPAAEAEAEPVAEAEDEPAAEVEAEPAAEAEAEPAAEVEAVSDTEAEPATEAEAAPEQEPEADAGAEDPDGLMSLMDDGIAQADLDKALAEAAVSASADETDGAADGLDSLAEGLSEALRSLPPAAAEEEVSPEAFPPSERPTVELDLSESAEALDADAAALDEEQVSFEEGFGGEEELEGWEEVVYDTLGASGVAVAAAHDDAAGDQVDDAGHPDETSVVFDDIEEEDGASSWGDALRDTVEAGHQGGEVAPPGGVFQEEAVEVSFDEIVEEVVAAKQISSDSEEEFELPVIHRWTTVPMEMGTPLDEVEVEEEEELTSDELSRLCNILAGPDGDLAYAAAHRLHELADERAASVLIALFPGRVKFDPFGPDWSLPEPAQLSPLIGFLVKRPDLGAEVAFAHLDSHFPALRWFAVYLFTRVHEPRAIKSVMPRLHDEEPRIRHLAAEALMNYVADAGFDVVIRHLRSRLGSPVAEVRRRAIYFLGFFKDVGSVPHLISCLGAREPELVAETTQALAAITMQTLGTSHKKWYKWWEKNRQRSRIDWLIDGLRHKDRNIRYAASVELVAIAKDTFGYDYDGKKRERDRAAKLWERWWAAERKRMRIDD